MGDPHFAHANVLGWGVELPGGGDVCKVTVRCTSKCR